MQFQLSKRSLERLAGVHPDLVRVVNAAIKDSEVDFVVLEGVRTLERQQQLFDKGATTTMRSRHLTGHAVDLAPVVGAQIRWDWPLYDVLAHSVKKAAQALDIPIEWGGDWVRFRDGPHFQLPWKQYP
jgi:peptidoglycan L-alanyl-D-glutamate endopeptidase CwlK